MIQVHDNLFSDEIQREMYQLAENGAYSPKQKAFAESNIRRMAMHLDINMPIITAMMAIIKQHMFDPDDYYLHDVYINANTMADAPLSHMDSRDDRDITAIYYANPEWDMDYGGETVFFDLTTGDIIKAVLPVPGRVVLFTSTIRHAARIQNRIAPTFRYTVAFKIKHKDSICATPREV